MLLCLYLNCLSDGGEIMAKYTAMDIARWFINRNQQAVEMMGGEPITLLKLLKLLYYAEGCSLALGNGSLFDEKIVAWEHGPVVKEVYSQYDDAYNLPFGSNADLASIHKIETKDCKILEEVFQVFGQYSAWALRNKTHDETPWQEVTDNGEHLNGTINRETMEKYFKEHYVS